MSCEARPTDASLTARDVWPLLPPPMARLAELRAKLSDAQSRSNVFDGMDWTEGERLAESIDELAAAVTDAGLAAFARVDAWRATLRECLDPAERFAANCGESVAC